MLQPGLLTLQFSQAAEQCVAGAGQFLLVQIQLMQATRICLSLHTRQPFQALTCA